MLKLQIECLQATSTLTQILPQLVEHGLERAFQPFDVADLGLEIATCSEPFPCSEGAARIRSTTDCKIEHLEHPRLETPCETVSWQPQTVADRARSHGREQLDAARLPARRRRQRQCGQATAELLDMTKRDLL